MHKPIEPKPLYPSMDTLDEAIAEIKARLPIENSIELSAALGLYHNTLLNIIEQETNNQE